MPEWRLVSSMPLRVSLVNLQKFTFHACADSPSMKMFAPEQNTRSLPLVTTTARTCGCSKRMRLQRVGELDVDAEVVAVQLELVAGAQAAVLRHVHRKRGDRTVEGELPVTVAGRLGLEVDAGRAWGGIVGRHGYYSSCMRFLDMHHTAFAGKRSSDGRRPCPGKVRTESPRTRRTCSRRAANVASSGCAAVSTAKSAFE